MTQPIRLSAVTGFEMSVWMTPLIGILAMQTGQAVAKVQANDWNFVSVTGDAMSKSESEAGVIYEAIIEARPFQEVIPSWTGDAKNGAKLSFRLIPEGPDGFESSGFLLGHWSEGNADAVGRTSVNDQKTDQGAVYTDTLSLSNPVSKVRVVVTGRPGSDGTLPKLDRLNLILTEPTPRPFAAGLPLRGTLLDVPLRAQANYEGGNVLCSPTSVSMILAYWAKRMETPTLDHDVPLVQSGVFDPGWSGTGNWAFNVAFAGSLPGMTGYVTRLRSIADIEAFVACGVPVATSVSYGLLKGKPAVEKNDGHLVVIVGFEDDGTPIFNDPGRNIVRLTYPRADFERAWANSKNTVYIIHPKGWVIPKDGPWPTSDKN